MILFQYFLFRVLILSLIILLLILRLASFFMLFIYLPYAENFNTKKQFPKLKK